MKHPVPREIIELEGPGKPVLPGAARERGQCGEKLLEGETPRSRLVHQGEHVVGVGTHACCQWGYVRNGKVKEQFYSRSPFRSLLAVHWRWHKALNFPN